jgi:putative membrane-bound dehydrogenase-like protein
MLRFSALICLFVSLCATASAQQLVAPTGPLTPAEQQKKFKLPPGFEIQLVASEPDVNKPMNLKFDAQGRLWITHSLEYPFAAKDGAKARDSITVFSDLGEDGRARKAQKFATGLNIPIGILPLPNDSAIAWSIPNLYRFTDTNGDGVADEKTVAYGPFGFTDTHGNQNGLTRWVDGWVYACHGFNNQSQVKIGGEGEVVMQLQSGNTYRFRADGSQIEQVSWGQVNPFGLCFDPLGNTFTADCHSRPVTMILREGHYQSFGKPHDGLGYAPEATHVDHGGTGIAGVVYYDAPQFPAEYRDVLFVGNVITNRIHCDRIKWNKSTPWIEKVEPFLDCDDPWFRPVDVQLGPDGALYVLDFYNKIIGHYEVPLTHPERDRERGRVWRIVYKGDVDKPKLATVPNMRESTTSQLAELLGDGNLNVRVMATNTLLDRFPKEADGVARNALKTPKNAQQQAHALWVVARTSGLDQELASALAKADDRLVRTHLMQALGEAKKWEAWQFELVRAALADGDPFVKRSAVTALAKHPHPANVAGLCKVLREAPEDDTQLAHATKISLRDQLRSTEFAEHRVADLQLDRKDYQQVLQIAALAPQGAGATIIYQAALRGEVDDALLAKALPAAARFVEADKMEELISFTKKRYAKKPASRLAVLRAMHEGLAQRGIDAPESLRSDLTEVLRATLTGKPDAVWTNVPVPGAPPSKSPWGLEPRKFNDGRAEVPVMSSLPGGELLTGVLRSPRFTLPNKLSFWMCGHNGLPTTPDPKKNYARLVLEDGTEVARSYPPRNDVAHPFTWDLAQHAGKAGYVEVVDDLSAAGYAWIAVAKFEPAVVTLPESTVGDREMARADLFRLAGQLKLTPLAEQAASAAKDRDQAPAVRLAACDALVSLQATDAVVPLTALISDAQLAAAQRQQAAELLGRIDRVDARQTLVAHLKTAPQPVAVAIASALAAKRESGELLLAEIHSGRASPALLREPTVVARLKSSGVAKLDEQITALTARLSPADDRIAALIKTRREKYLAGQYSVDTGKAVFAKSACAQCHKVGETGATIAPALNGIGSRGLDRLLEDTLDPNRNVDQAFRVTSITTEDGQVVNGFGPREEGKTLVLFDQTGKPVRVQLDDVAEKHVLPLSPMPANLSEQIPENDFLHLLAYLLSQQTKE